MRILSQEGLNMDYDIPYEQVCLNINKRNEKSFRVYAWHSLSNSDDGCYLMAEYSSLEKARRAMEILRNAYSPKIEIKEPIEKEMPKPKACDWIWSVKEPKIDVLDNFYFRFPQDSEVGV